MKPETVAVLGASPDPERYSHKALRALAANGHSPLPVNPQYGEVDGTTCYPDLASCPEKIDTVTVYVKPKILAELVEDIIEARPRRVILNPGTECQGAAEVLRDAGIEVEEACTLVLLSSGQFLGD